jgi:tRNA-guanine family transglycosylase
MAREILSCRLNTVHNLFYYTELMASIRKAILDQHLTECVADIAAHWGVDEENQDSGEL